MKKKQIALVAIATAAILALSGCSGSSSSDTDVLTVGINTPPISIDPLKAANGIGRWYQDPAYASVLSTDKDGKVIAGLADKWGYVGTDNKSFSFTLREGLVFADGTPVTAQAVVDSYNYFKENGSGPTKAYFAAITAEAAGDLQVNLTSTEPNPIMDLLLTEDNLAFSPISPEGLKDDNARSAETFGVGPYVLDSAETVPNDHYTYVKNPNYYDTSAAKFDKIEVKVILDATQLVQAVKTGQVDVVQVDPTVADTSIPENINKIDRVGAWNGIYITDRNGTVVPAFASQYVRQALSWAVDRASIASSTLGSYGGPGVQPAVPGPAPWGYDPALEKTYGYDVDKAKALLAKGGFPDGFAFDLLYVAPDQSSARLAQAVADQLSKIGVTVTLKPAADFGAWVNDFVSGKYGATIGGGASLPMFLQAQFGFTPTAIMNPYQVSDPEVNAAFAALASAPSDKAGPAAQALTKVLTTKAVTVPVVQQKLIYMINDRLTGVDWIGDSAYLTSIITWSTK